MSCEFCSGKTPLMIGAVRSSIEELVPYRLDVNEFDNTIVLATNNDESYVSIKYCPMCGRELPDKNIFIERVKEYFNHA